MKNDTITKLTLNINVLHGTNAVEVGDSLAATFRMLGEPERSSVLKGLDDDPFNPWVQAVEGSIYDHNGTKIGTYEWKV